MINNLFGVGDAGVDITSDGDGTDAVDTLDTGETAIVLNQATALRGIWSPLAVVMRKVSMSVRVERSTAAS